MDTKSITSLLEYLETGGGTERFDFWLTKDGSLATDARGNYIQDIDAAYAFGQELRKQNPDVKVDISNNVVRVSVPSKTAVH